MALKKDIKLENDIVLSYHRIANIDNKINEKTTIIIYSYINQFQRDRQKEGVQISNGISDIYMVPSNVSIEYNQKLTVKEAYDYLKTLDMFKDAEDVYEEED